jgi:hypothetical protein
MSIYACVLSYKMAERTNKTVEQLTAHGFTPGADLLVFENQHPGVPGLETAETLDCSRYVSEFTGANLRMTGGFNYIMRRMEALGPHTAVWLCTNDFDIVQAPKDLPEYLEYVLYENKDIGWLHPAKTHVDGYAYDWMDPKGQGLRRTWMTDFICPVLRWDAMTLQKRRLGPDSWWFDPVYHRGWGIDYETCYELRKSGYSVVVDDSFIISHEASETYRAGKAPESQDEFYKRALAEMNVHLARKYGVQWYSEFKKGF